jgi:hypothetical protein
MKTATGTAEFTRSAGMDIALGLRHAIAAGEIALFDAYKESLTALQNNAVTPQQILSATFFTVRQVKSLLFGDYNGLKTHLNVVTRESTDRSIEWKCETLSISPELCERARQAPLAEQ